MTAPGASPRPMPRVLLVSRSLPCHVAGGLEFHVVELARALARRGLAVDVLTTPLPPGGEPRLTEPGLSVHEVLGAPPGRYSIRYFRLVGPRIEQLNAEIGYDVIHGHEFGFGFWRPPPGFGPRLVLSVHGTLLSETPLDPGVFPGLSLGLKVWAVARFGRRWLYGPWWRRSLGRADLLLVDSDFTLGELERLDARLLPRLRRVRLGLAEDELPAIDRVAARAALGWGDQPSEGPVLITVGRLEWQKGHDLALKALARLKDRPWRYVIVGEGGRQRRLKALARRLGLADRVEFTGRAPQPLKLRLLAAADVFVWPERTHPAFGLVGLEALAMGTPVLAARRGAIAELIEPGGGWLFDANDEGALVAALENVLSETERRKIDRAALRASILSRFNARTMSEGVHAAYAELLGGD